MALAATVPLHTSLEVGKALYLNRPAKGVQHRFKLSDIGGYRLRDIERELACHRLNTSETNVSEPESICIKLKK